MSDDTRECITLAPGEITDDDDCGVSARSDTEPAPADPMPAWFAAWEHERAKERRRERKWFEDRLNAIEGELQILMRHLGCTAHEVQRQGTELAEHVMSHERILTLIPGSRGNGQNGRSDAE